MGRGGEKQRLGLQDRSAILRALFRDGRRRDERDDRGAGGKKKGRAILERRAENRAYHEPAEMARVVDEVEREADDQVDADKEEDARQKIAPDFLGQVDVSEIQKRSERSGDPEHGAGGAGAHDIWMPDEACSASPEPGEQVDREKLPVPEHPFGEPAEAPEAPHVETDMEHAEVEKGGREQTPPLPVHGVAAEIGAERQELPGTGRGR